jgi:peptidoglycan hydrolase-like amidase
MKALYTLLTVVLLIVFSSFFLVPRSFSDELDDINKKINDLTAAMNMSKAATAPLETQLIGYRKQIDDIKQRVSAIEADIVVKKKNIDVGYKDLAKQEAILSRAIHDFYVKSYSNSPLLVFLSASSASEVTQILAYQKAATNQDKAIITNIALSIGDLETKKKDLEDEQTRLTALKSNLDKQSAELDKIVSGAKAYQATLSSQIAELSAKQQQLLAQKQASLGLPTSAYTTSGGCSSDLTNGKDPGFSPRIAFFTYGVPHRVGMSQYGAKGRAESGQSYQDILKFYFPSTDISSVSTSTNIHVVGTNEYGQSFDDNWSIEDYVKHIYEIPTSWHSNALKAQAIAARSYALATTNNGANTICPSQACQVVKKELNSDAWVQAVNDTAGQVVTSGGNPIKAWFSSTAGGYTFSSGDVFGGSTPYTRNSQDASGSINNFGDLQSNAYDKASPWFYCDWGGRSAYGGTAWLKPEEVADIVNVISLLQSDSSLKEHLYQTDKPNPAGTDTWDAGKVKQELQSRGGTVFSSVSDVNVSADFGSGRTTTVNVSGDGGSKSFPGDLFKTYFNIRAPSNINIVGPLYNVEKR